jgi:outer membrane lipase/esterase
VFVPQIMAEWRHEFEDDSRNIKARYIHDVTNTSFSVPTDDPDRDYFALGAGLSVLLGRGIGAFFNYETALGLKRITHHQFTAGFRMEF